MASRRLRSARLQKGSRVSVCVDHKIDLLLDMGLTGPNQKTLTGVIMFGTIKRTTKNTYRVELPAAECSYFFTKEKVSGVADDKEFPVVYVTFGSKVKKVVGLTWGNNFMPTDYYDNEPEANAAAKKYHSQSQSSALVENSADTATSTPSQTTTLNAEVTTDTVVNKILIRLH